MGLFDIIMTAMGFENENKKPKKVKKEKKEKKVPNNHSAKFNLNQKNSSNGKVKLSNNLQKLDINKSLEECAKVVVHTPKTQKEVQKVSDKLAEGEYALVNLSNFEEKDKIRAIDFLSGVAYILKFKIQRLEGSIFFIAAEGVEPMEYEVQ